MLAIVFLRGKRRSFTFSFSQPRSNKPRFLSIFSQGKVGKRVERAAAYVLTTMVKQRCGPAEHLLRGLACEGQQQNRLWSNPFFDQSGYPVCDSFNRATRYVTVRVLPLPAPAITRIGPCIVVTASYWAVLSTSS